MRLYTHQYCLKIPKVYHERDCGKKKNSQMHCWNHLYDCNFIKSKDKLNTFHLVQNVPFYFPRCLVLRQFFVTKKWSLFFLILLMSATLILYSFNVVTSDLDGTHLSRSRYLYYVQLCGGQAGYTLLWCWTQQAREESRMEDAVCSCGGEQKFVWELPVAEAYLSLQTYSILLML